MMHHKNPKRIRLGALAVATMILTSTMSMMNIDGMLYQANILNYPEHKSFDGTVYPVKKTPNWVKLSSNEYDNKFTEIPSSKMIDLPYYNPNELKKSTQDLIWGDPEDDAIRTAKITYSVPYMGNYKFDGKEYAGSHPAVDIKIPSDTPIYSIANGTVIKATEQSSGFGNHIVVMHNNFPSLNNSNKKETLYVSYSHLGKLYVDSGDVVDKGEKIALSGDTGTATTPHLHFQMDNDDAPWHPYWPFTWSEAQDAGLDFFGAVNAGLGQSNAKKVTVHPLKYIQTYMDDSNYDKDDFNEEQKEVNNDEEKDSKNANSYVNTNNSDNKETVLVNEIANEEVVVEEVVVEEVVVEEVVIEEVEERILAFDFQLDDTYYKDFNGIYHLNLTDQFGNSGKNLFKGNLTLTSDKGKFLPKSTILSLSSFEKDGTYTANFKKMKKTGKDRFKLTYDGKMYFSDWFEIINDDFQFSDVPHSHKYASAIYGLVEKDVISGYSDGSFRLDQNVNRVEAIKFILEGVNSNIYKGNSPFKDIMKDSWYLNYLYTAYKKGIVNGDPDGNFRPGDNVKLSEFLKILFNGMDIDIDQNVTKKPYDDVNTDDWFAPYISYAKEIGIIDKNANKIYPAKNMTRGEVADAIYKVMNL